MGTSPLEGDWRAFETALQLVTIPIVLYLQRPDAEAFRLASILLGIYIGVILRCIVYLKEIFYGY